MSYHKDRPASSTYPTTQWDEGEIVLDWHRLALPNQISSGNYTVGLALRDSASDLMTDEISLGTLQVTSDPRQFNVPSIANLLEETFNHEIKLLGYDLTTEQKVAKLTLYWKALKPPLASYTVFVHLLDARDQIITQQDNLPRNNIHPTNTWLTGEIVADTYLLRIPSDSERRSYRIAFGLYNAVTGARLRTSDGRDHLTIGSVVFR